MVTVLMIVAGTAGGAFLAVIAHLLMGFYGWPRRWYRRPRNLRAPIPRAEVRRGR